MDTECRQPENYSNNPANVAVNEESVPMQCSSISDEFSTTL